MEVIKHQLDDGTGRAFDDALKDTLPDGGDLQIITKDAGTVNGNPVAILTFTVELPDGTFRKAQTVTTVALLMGTLAILRGKYGTAPHERN